MLSRTAANMFWLARYIERAENLARLLDVSYRLSLLHMGEDDGLEAWRMGLEIADDDELFAERYGRVTPEAVLTYLGLDRDNPASIVASLVRARENARILRNQITQEMWEAINDTWLGLERFEGSAARLGEGGVTVFLEWVRERSHLFRGVTYGTMLHDDGFWFVRLGTFIERADNTARLLLFKAAEVGPGDEPDASDLVYYQWASLLRALGGFRGYHRTYRDAITPTRVVAFALLNPAMPRSLRHCLDHVIDSLDWLETPADAPLRLNAQSLRGQLTNARVEDLVARGLESVLEDFMERNAALADELRRQYMGLGASGARMEQSQASR
jgi:uncharacterized alpha-E superfamily protein